LVEVVTTTVGPRRATDQWSYPDFLDLRDAQTGVSMTGWARGSVDITIPVTEEVRKASPVTYVSPNYFSTMGVVLTRGMGFDDGTEPMVIPAFNFWQERLGADPDIVGKMLAVNGVPHLVTGIAPERFEGHVALSESDLFLPLERYPGLLGRGNTRIDRSKTWVHIHGRLAPGVNTVQASAAVAAVTTHLANEYRATNEFTAGVVAPYTPLGTLEGADVNVVIALWNTMMVIPLVVVCLNVSGMVQVRSAMRERELSIRQAIGASRGRLMQHLLAESVVLATLGGTLAALVLVNALPLISWWIDEPIPPHMQEVLRLDLPILALCAGLCLATSLVCGWLPALRFSIPMIMTVLKDDVGSGSARAGWVHRVTSAMQVAVAVPLVVVSVMSLDRVLAIATADLGFDAEHLYAAPLPAAEGDVSLQIRKVRDTLESASGVASVTVADGLPLDSRYRMTRVATQPDGAAPRALVVHVTRVGDNYLDTMGIALLRGRGFARDDGAAAPLVTVISKALADKLFPDSDALDQRLTFQPPGNQNAEPYTLTIVGVTEDFPTSQIGTDREQILLPLAQHPDVRRDSVLVSDDRQGTQHVMVVARAAPGEPALRLTGALENAMREVDPDFDRSRLVVGASLRRSMIDGFRDTSAFSAIAGGMVLLLAALGIYGVVGLMVSTRTREIAVRVTLGATRARVMAMILFDILKLVAPGVAVGLVVTASVNHLQGGVAVGNAETLAYVAAAAVGLLTAVVASLAPARRAASVDPMVAMRVV
jgi:predicted permease